MGYIIYKDKEFINIIIVVNFPRGLGLQHVLPDF